MLTMKHQLSIVKHQPFSFSIRDVICPFLKNPHTTENMSAPAIHGGKEGKICNEQNGQGPQNTTDTARPMLKVYRLYND